jgi:hypothetical protein
MCIKHEKKRPVSGSQNNARKISPVVVKDVAITFIQPVWSKRHVKPKVSPGIDGVVGTELALVQA